MNCASPSKKKRGEAEPTRPGRVGRWEARRRRALASGVDVLLTGRRSSDRRLFRRQSTIRPVRFGKIFHSYLRYLRYLWANCDVHGRLCASASLCFSLCLCASVVH